LQSEVVVVVVAGVGVGVGALSSPICIIRRRSWSSTPARA